MKKEIKRIVLWDQLWVRGNHAGGSKGPLLPMHLGVLIWGFISGNNMTAKSSQSHLFSAQHRKNEDFQQAYRSLV